MATMVFQSFRTQGVPPYIPSCLQSVQGWAREAGYAYTFFDDEFLRLVPEWYRAKAGLLICVVADLARLIQARAFLLQGLDQVVWVDADVIVFDVERFRLPATRGFRYCKEVWLHRLPSGEVSSTHNINNSVCMFGPESIDHLTKYIDRCLTIVRETPQVKNGTIVGTNVLASSFSGTERIENVGIVSPVLLQAILQDEGDVLARYIAWQGAPIFAANLCNLYRLFYADVPGLFDYLVEHAAAKLLATKGGLLAGIASPALKG